MQSVSQNFLQALDGSFRPIYLIDAWYDGQLVLATDDLPILSGSVTIDSTRAIAGSASVVSSSPDGKLLPASFDSPLACYGSQLHIRAGIDFPSGPELVSLGWFRIDSYSGAEQWRKVQRRTNTIGDILDGGLYPGDDTYPGDDVYPGSPDRGEPVGPPQWLLVGTQISNDCSDLMSSIDDAQMLVPQQPSQLLSALDEIVYLASGIVPVEDFSAITDAPIPRSITYGTSLTQAIADLAALVGCVPQMSPDGALGLISINAGAPVWKVSVSAEEVPLLGWTRSGDRTGVYNGVVSAGASVDGTPLQGVAHLSSGPLRWAGPFGQVPFGQNNALLTTPNSAKKDAASKLRLLSATQTVVITITCPANFALQTFDVLTVELPDRSFPGVIQSLGFTIGAAVMTIQLVVSRDDLWSTVPAPPGDN